MHGRRIKAGRGVVLAGLSLAAALAVTGWNGERASRGAASGSPESTTFNATACGTYSGRGCAPASSRVDLRRPTFSKSPPSNGSGIGSRPLSAAPVAGKSTRDYGASAPPQTPATPARLRDLAAAKPAR
jgi:hypothetical protein